MKLRASIAVALVLVTGALIGAPASLGSGASPPGPSTFATGFMDYYLTAQHPKEFQRAVAAGAQWVRLSVGWYAVAPQGRPAHFNAANPNSPGYNWAPLDHTLALAAADHLQVLLNIDGAPSWAEGPGRPRSISQGTWKPNAAALGAFAHALAERYSGSFTTPATPKHPGQTLPKITHFQIWNEPNLDYYLSPQWTPRRGGGYSEFSPNLYRNMLNAAYAGIKSAQPQAFVMSAGTAPYGDPAGGERMHPVTFMEGLFCLSTHLRALSCPSATHLDGLDHHPYGGIPTLKALAPADVAIADMGKLEHILSVAERDHRVLPAGPKPYWVTEIAWDTIPPEFHGAAFPVSVPEQARYLGTAYYELWSEGVSHVLWYLIQDDPQQAGFSGAGLYFSNNRPKPAEREIAFPFIVMPAHGEARVWGRAPSTGRVLIQQLKHGRWVQISALSTSSGGVFLAYYHLPDTATLRAVSGTKTSLAFDAGKTITYPKPPA